MNSPLLQTPVGRLRLCTLAEGISFLVLLFIAMPLKYWGDLPIAVKIAGMIHGVLFLALCLLLVLAMRATGWPWKKGALIFVAALVPFGPFVIDRRLKEEEEREALEFSARRE